MERYIRSNSVRNTKPFLLFNNISFKDNLNNEQLKVVNNIKGPMIVIAGAGSGKTRTITYSVVKLIENGVKPAEIMLVTFTNKAAKEMLERVENLLGKNPKGIWGGTFHALANRFIRKYTNLAGLKPRYTIIDQADAYSLMKLAIEDAFPHFKLMNLPNKKNCFKILSYTLNCNKSIKQVLDWKYLHLYQEEIIPKLRKIFNNYANRKIKANLVDFNDLLTIWNRLLNEKTIAQKMAKKIKYILVDEYQDTNYIQAEIILKIAQINQNIMVVGDDVQSIYSFRGANFKNLLNFGEKLKNVRKYKITMNYRSTPEILDLANNSIKNNEIQFQKIMNPVKKSLHKPKCVFVNNEEDQAKFIIREILDFKKKGISLSEIAILYRSNFHSLKLQKELQSSKLPFEVRSGVSFFEQAHIKDVLAYIKIIYNPYDEISWNRIFQIIPSIGAVSAQKIFKKIVNLKDPINELTSENFLNSNFKEFKISKNAKNNLFKYLRVFAKFNSDSSPSAFLKIIRRSIEDYIKREYENYKDRLNDIDALYNFSLEFKNIRDFLDNLNLNASEVSETIKVPLNKDKNKERIVLSTIHKAKGLEWKVVFVISLTETLFPPKQNDEKSEIEEERRIFYVSLTRAKDALYLITPKSRHGKNYLRPSRFVRELKDSLYELIDNSNNLYENLDIPSNSQVPKKIDNIDQKKTFLPEFTTADELLKKKERSF